MNIAKHSGKLFTSQAINAVIGFVGIAFFARELNPSQMGVFFLFEAVLGILSLVADLGLKGAVEKRMSEGQPGGEVLSTALLMKAALLITISVVILPLSGFFNSYVGMNISVFLLVSLALKEIAEMQVKVLGGEKRVGEQATPEIAREVFWVGIGSILVTQGYGVTGLIYGYFAGFLAMFLWSFHLSETSVGRPSVRCGRSLFEFSKYYVVSDAQSYIYSWMDIAIIGLFLTQAAAGVYEIAWRISESIVILSYAIATTVLPQISSWHAQGLTDRIGDLISRAIVPSLVFVIPAFGGAIILSTEILLLLFGSEYVAASLVLVILSGEKIGQVLYRLFSQSLSGINQPDLAARAIVITITTNTVLNVVLVQFIGIEGIALATAVSFTLGAFLHGRSLAQYTAIRFPGRKIGWCVFSTGVMVAVIQGISSVYAVNDLLTLCGVIISGAVVYSAILVVYQPIRIQLLENARSVIS